MLDKMFKMVGFKGVDYDLTKQEGWFNQKTWTKEEEQKFCEYFIINAKKDLGWSRKEAESQFSWFNLMWGWKIKE
jgi:hypothetical protein